MPPRRARSQRQVGLALGFRSGLEEDIAAQLRTQGVHFDYESLRIPFVPSPKPRRYTPDFVLHNGIIIESKGRFLTEDRQKHKLIKAQHPDLDIRFVFSNSNTRISKQSQTTYAVWARTHGFLFSDVRVPLSWLREPRNERSLAAILRITEGL